MVPLLFDGGGGGGAFPLFYPEGGGGGEFVEFVELLVLFPLLIGLPVELV